MNASAHSLELPALDGTNPLGFLAALGTLAVLSESDPAFRLGWRRGPKWTAFLTRNKPFSDAGLARLLARKLRGKSVPPASAEQCAAAAKQLARAKKALKAAQQELKSRKLRGKERESAFQSQVEPLRCALTRARQNYLDTLKLAAPSPELAVGDRPDCTVEEFRQHASDAVRADARPSRGVADLLIAFGCESGSDNDQRITATPFCFISGSGHQWFLKTVRDLMAKASVESVCKALLQLWDYSDPGLSMRWDPVEDTRYALRLDDPGPAGVTTVWMANLLAYRALVFFPCAWDGRSVATAGWTADQSCFTWPLWETPLTADTVGSLVRHPAFGEPDLAPWKAELRARGVSAIYRSRRIKVGSGTNYKVNFTPAQAA